MISQKKLIAGKKLIEFRLNFIPRNSIPEKYSYSEIPNGIPEFNSIPGELINNRISGISP